MQQLLKIYLALILAFAPLLTFGQIIVGKINDKYNVTPCGQFSYEIPMSVVSGTGGMVPYLSFPLSLKQKVFCSLLKIAISQETSYIKMLRFQNYIRLA